MLHEKALVAAAAMSSSGGPQLDFSGRWTNQIGSIMDLAVSGSEVTGRYTSKTSGAGGPTTGPLKGYVAGDLVSFLVLWPSGSMTAWVGQLVDDQTNPTIKTLWNLVTDVSDEDEADRLWTSVFTGADEFTR
ncbi:MAG: avidin/streptavidin family protein [Pseudomonadota bacterium]